MIFKKTFEQNGSDFWMDWSLRSDPHHFELFCGGQLLVDIHKLDHLNKSFTLRLLNLKLDHENWKILKSCVWRTVTLKIVVVCILWLIYKYVDSSFTNSSTAAFDGAHMRILGRGVFGIFVKRQREISWTTMAATVVDFPVPGGPWKVIFQSHIFLLIKKYIKTDMQWRNVQIESNISSLYVPEWVLYGVDPSWLCTTCCMSLQRDVGRC